MCLCPIAPFSILSHPFRPRIVCVGVKVYLETNSIFTSTYFHNCDFSKHSFLFLALKTASKMAAFFHHEESCWFSKNAPVWPGGSKAASATVRAPRLGSWPPRLEDLRWFGCWVGPSKTPQQIWGIQCYWALERFMSHRMALSDKWSLLAIHWESSPLI